MVSTMLFAGLLGILGQGAPHASAQKAINPDKPLTVCQALQNRAQYRGKVIEIKGEWNGAALTASCPQFKTGTRTWVNGVLIAFAPGPTDTPTNWTSNMFDYKVAQKEAEDMLRKGADIIEAVLVGRFESRPELLLKNGQPHGYGGDLLPAQLVFVSVKHVNSAVKSR